MFSQLKGWLSCSRFHFRKVLETASLSSSLAALLKARVGLPVLFMIETVLESNILQLRLDWFMNLWREEYPLPGRGRTRAWII